MSNEHDDDRLAIEGGKATRPQGIPAPNLLDERVRAMLLQAYESGDWGRYEGQFVPQLAHALAQLHGVEHVFTCCSGTFAVELALRAVGVTAGDEVILSAYDFPGNFRAIEAVGARPLLVDIEPDTWCLDGEALASQLPSLLGPRTRAIVVSHLHGGLADMSLLTQLAGRHGLKVVEDACQATGASVQGRVAGTWGDVGVLSFGGSKLLSAGRGGAILTRQGAVHQRAKIFCHRGNDAFALSELQAAVLLPQVEQLPARNALRRSGAGYLREACTSNSLIDWSGPRQPRGEPSFYKLAARCLVQEPVPFHRDLLVRALQAEGIPVGVGFRGFLRRGARRCRKSDTLENARRAADATIVFHHALLLEPNHALQQVAEAICKIERRWELLCRNCPGGSSKTRPNPSADPFDHHSASQHE